MKRLSERILPLKRQGEIVSGWLLQRLESFLPILMQREGFDMWIIAAREYNEDPVMMTMLPASQLSARRLSILVFFLRPDGSVERMGVTRHSLNMEDYYQPMWDGLREEQWACVARLVKERNPQTIGINTSADFAFGDGLSQSLYLELQAALGPDYDGRCWSAERLALGWLERRIQPEIDAYDGIVQIAHDLIAIGYSRQVLHPGVTTADDLAWWFRQTMTDIGLRAWFHPTVQIHRRGEAEPLSGEVIIRPGDMLHCDIGLHYLGLATDTQQLAYVLEAGEVDAPGGLLAGLKAANRLQDMLEAQFVAGRTGNEILSSTLDQARREGLKPCVYSHPLGYHGHGAGPMIGLADAQAGVPGRGDYELFDETAHSFELNARHTVTEWDDQEVMFALEQDVIFTGGRVRYLAGRQTRFHLV